MDQRILSEIVAALEAAKKAAAADNHDAEIENGRRALAIAIGLDNPEVNAEVRLALGTSCVEVRNRI
jgi:hypothetical protein